MNHCEFCPDQVPEFFFCYMCDRSFCAECGDPEQELCGDCLLFEEEDD